MKHTDLFVAAFLLCTFSAMAGERIEPVPFGDMDQWVTRIMQESKLLGGHTKTIYAVGPTDTIRGNIPYSYGSKGNPWTTSNVYAKVAGVEKISGSTRPERRGNVTSGKIAFGISPRLNAAGRMDNADIALKLLLETDFMKASEYAGFEKVAEAMMAQGIV